MTMKHAVFFHGRFHMQNTWANSQVLPGFAVDDVRLRGKSLTESMVSSAEAAKEEDMERLLVAMMGELEEQRRKERKIK